MSVVNQHENAYGVLELDFQRRARNVPRQPQAGGGGFQRPQT